MRTFSKSAYKPFEGWAPQAGPRNAGRPVSSFSLAHTRIPSPGKNPDPGGWRTAQPGVGSVSRRQGSGQKCQALGPHSPKCPCREMVCVLEQVPDNWPDVCVVSLDLFFIVEKYP